MTELIIAAWAFAAAALFLPLGRLGRAAQRLAPVRAFAGAPVARGAARLASWPVTIALVVIFVAGTIYLGPRLLKRVLDTDHPVAAITSQSMYPALKRGDLVLLEGVERLSDLEVGDIIAFEEENHFTIHRIVRLEGEEIVTKGDARLDEDKPITFDDVIARAVRVGGRLAKVPYLGNIPLVFGTTSDPDDNLPTAQDAPLEPEDSIEDGSRYSADEDTGRRPAGSRSPQTGTNAPEAAEEEPNRSDGRRWP